MVSGPSRCDGASRTFVGLTYLSRVHSLRNVQVLVIGWGWLVSTCHVHGCSCIRNRAVGQCLSKEHIRDKIR